MSSEGCGRAAELFLAASEMPEGERRAWLEGACGDDRELLAEVLELLAYDLDPFGAIPACAPSAPDETPSSAFVRRLSEQRPRAPRYRLVAEIARGGMGAILKVWDKALGRQLAMKVVLGHAEAARTGATPPIPERTLARFLEEAKITGQLDHPGIVPVHELGVDDQGRVFFTMRLVKGRTLQAAFDELHAAGGEQGRARALGVLSKVCEAMAYAHEHGVVHRDLKPANVMVGRFGEVYVMDWGLGRVTGQEDRKDIRLAVPQGPSSALLEGERSSELVTRDGDVIGTPAYMAPEQARGDLAAIGKRSDVYSVGAMLYHLLAGRPPYSERSGERVDALVVYTLLLQGPPARIERVAPGVSPELVSICERAMARDPAARYPDMRAMDEDLRAFLEDRVVRAHRTGALVELQKWVRRNRLAAAASGLLLVVLVASALVVALLQSERARLALATQRQAREALSVALLERATELGPIDPASLDAYGIWLRDAREAVADSDAAGERLLALAERGTLLDASPGPAGAMRRRLLDLRERHLMTIGEARRKLEEPDLDPTVAEDVRRQLEILTKEADRLETSAATFVESECVRAAGLRRFAAAEDQVAFDRARRHVMALDDLRARAIPTVVARMELARRLAETSIERHRERWQECLADVASPSGPYGFSMAPQLGLVPLGKSPQGLWEFWHVLSGEEPRVHGDRVELHDEAGVVLVLVPAGDYALERHREPVHVAAFFLGKHELTQGQWLRMTGENPSMHFVGSRIRGNPRVSMLNPVEQIDAARAATVLRTAALRLPSLDEWLAVAATSRIDGDPLPRDNIRGWQVRSGPDPRDGFVTTNRVDAFEPSALGFHGLFGNVSEWVEGEVPPEEMQFPSLIPFRWFCGLSFVTLPADAAPLIPYARIATGVDEFLGARAARSIDDQPF